MKSFTIRIALSNVRPDAFMQFERLLHSIFLEKIVKSMCMRVLVWGFKDESTSLKMTDSPSEMPATQFPFGGQYNKRLMLDMDS